MTSIVLIISINKHKQRDNFRKDSKLKYYEIQVYIPDNKSAILHMFIIKIKITESALEKIYARL